MTETEKIVLLLEIFGWEDSTVMRFNALYVLRKARLEEIPSWDEYRCCENQKSAG